MNDKKVSVAQIGVGRWGVNLTRVLANNPNVTLTHICDANIKSAKNVAERYNAVPVSEFKDILNNSLVDAIVVSTPSSLHFEHSLAAILASKHVLVEKPMTTSTKDAKELLAAAKVKDIKLMVGHTFLYNNAVIKIRDIIESDELGEIYYIYSRRLNLGQFRKDSDVLWTLAPHDISIVNYWLDEIPMQVTARGLQYANPQRDLPEVCFSQLDYPSGRTAQFHLSWLDPQKCREMVIIGSKKMLVYDDTQADRMIQIYDKSVEDGYNDAPEDITDFRSRLRAGDTVIPNFRMTEPLSNEITEFISCIINNREPLTNGSHGTQTVAVMEAMATSIRNNGSAVEVDLIT